METRSTDAKGRVSLPQAFANATGMIEQVSGDGGRRPKGRGDPEDEVRFLEETVPRSRTATDFSTC